MRSDAAKAYMNIKMSLPPKGAQPANEIRATSSPLGNVNDKTTATLSVYELDMIPPSPDHRHSSSPLSK